MGDPILNGDNSFQEDVFNNETYRIVARIPGSPNWDVTTKNADGTKVVESYLNGRLDKIDRQDSAGSTVSSVDYTYDPQNRMRTMKTHGNAGTSTTTWNYHAQRGWLESKVYDDTTDTNYTYTSAGRLKTRTWERGVVTTYGYNAAGDLNSTDYSDSTPDIAITYTRWGAQKEVTDALGTRTFNYNSDLTLKSEELDGVLDGKFLTRKYDSLGRNTGFKVGNSEGASDNYEVTYGYDPDDGRFKTVTRGADTFTYAYEPDSASLIQSVTGPAHTVTNTWEDYRDVLDTKTNSVGGSPVSSYNYAVNSLGQRTGVNLDGSAFGNPNPAISINWDYNDVGELESADHDVNAQDFGYVYDGIGNRLKSVAGTTDTSDSSAIDYNPDSH